MLQYMNSLQACACCQLDRDAGQPCIRRKVLSVGGCSTFASSTTSEGDRNRLHHAIIGHQRRSASSARPASLLDLFGWGSKAQTPHASSQSPGYASALLC